MIVKGIKIGIDFHGVITKQPEFFSKLTKLAFNAGCEIHIITGGPRRLVKEYLEEHKISYSKIFAILDFYAALDKVEYFENGEFKVSDKLWDTAKAKYCLLHNISLHIDDSHRYIRWFQTPFCHYEEKKQCCITQNKMIINFSGTPAEAFREMQQIIEAEKY